MKNPKHTSVIIDLNIPLKKGILTNNGILVKKDKLGWWINNFNESDELRYFLNKKTRPIKIITISDEEINDGDNVYHPLIGIKKIKKYQDTNKILLAVGYGDVSYILCKKYIGEASNEEVKNIIIKQTNKYVEV